MRNQFAALSSGAMLFLCFVAGVNAQTEPLGGQPTCQNICARVISAAPQSRNGAIPWSNSNDREKREESVLACS